MDADELQAMLDVGDVSLPRDVYVLDRAPVIPPHTALNLNGSTLILNLSRPDDTGIRLSDFSALLRGTVRVWSTGEPGAQGFYHAAVSIGEPNGAGMVWSPGAFQYVRGWTLANLTVSTSRPGGPAVQIMGGAHGGLIENVEIPDGAPCSGIHLDWSDVGGIRSGGPQEIEETRRRFDAGEAFTTHPHHITLRNVRVGRLPTPRQPPDIGTRAVRISACHDITIEGLQCAGTTAPSAQVHGGDLGFEFAPPLVKASAMRNIVVRGARITGSNAACYVDTYADNVDRAKQAGYKPLMDPIMPGRVLIDGLTTFGLGGDGAADGDGVRVENADGVELLGVSATKHHRGIYVGDRGASRVRISGEDCPDNAAGGVVVARGLEGQVMVDFRLGKA